MYESQNHSEWKKTKKKKKVLTAKFYLNRTVENEN